MISTASPEVAPSFQARIEPCSGTFRLELPNRAASLVCGALLGLSAPGFEQWYLPWFGMIPLLYFTVTAKSPWLAGVRGFYFGTGFNLVYTCWYLFFRSMYGTGTFGSFPVFLCISFWVLMSMGQ